MFSGLIAYQGRVAVLSGGAGTGMRLVVDAPEALADGVEPKDSVAINGVCLTVVARDLRTMTFDVVPESVRRAGFESLATGDAVNVELSLRLGDRIGGHLVYGHVDAHAAVLGKATEGQGFRVTIERPTAIAPLIIEKGYIAVDGVSLTVASVDDDRFTVALIPETARRTTLGTKGRGAQVNLEADPVARYALGAMHALAAAQQQQTTSDELAWAYEI
jgi:riboflavin synthase alpha subunit